MIQRAAAFAALIVFLGLQPDVAVAQSSMREKVNAGRVTIITGGAEYVNSSYMRYAGEMASATNKPGELRVLPIMGEGPVENIRDILYLQGIDIGILHSDALTYVERKGLFPEAGKRLRYLAKLYDEYFHVIAHRDIESVADLAGKKVVIGKNEFSGSTVSALTVLDLLGIEIETVYDDWGPAVEKVDRGEVAAIMYTTVRGSDFVKSIEGKANIRFLPLPFDPSFAGTYEPEVFTSAHYPNLIAQGDEVATVKFGTIMAVYNWVDSNPRYRNVSRFTTALFNNIEAMHEPPYHPRWKNFDPASEAPASWARFQPAKAWIAAREEEERRIAAAAAAAEEEQRKQREAALSGQLRTNAEFAAFADYMREKGGLPQATDDEMLKLFKRFMSWRKLEDEKPIN